MKQYIQISSFVRIKYIIIALSLALAQCIPYTRLQLFKAGFQNCFISSICGLIDVNRKGSKSIGHWDHYMYVTIPPNLASNCHGQGLK